MVKYVTILDIARELGISKSTVSRALSGDTSNVKAATIEKILGTLHARSPTITAVEQPVEEMAKEACRLLLAHLQDANLQAEDIVLRGETIFRESFPKKSV